jgi:hypothetical protein
MSDAALAIAAQARGLAAGAAVASNDVAILVLGQSNEQGSVVRTEAATYPLAFFSAINPGVICPMAPDVGASNRGSWWPYVYDVLYRAGYNAQIINGAIGGMGLVRDVVGFLYVRANNTAYYGRRSSPVYPDRGDFGDLMYVGAYLVAVTTGRHRSTLWGGSLPNPIGAAAIQDYISFGTSITSGGSAPDLSAISVGATVSDGGLTLTRLDASLYADDGAFNPAGNRVWGSMCGELMLGQGHDPLGILMRGWEALAKTHAKRKLVYFANGQTDLGYSASAYQRAVQIAMNFFLRRGCEVIIGNTIYSPGSAGSTSTNYGNQVTGVANAISALSAAYPGKVHAGANLYGSMGSTGVMGGQAFTGSISGSTLTVSAVVANSGSGLAIGQTVYNGQSVVGTISALGTGAGGTGTYTLTGAVTTASTSLTSAGAWLQYDGIHLNGAGCVGPDVGGVSCAGKYVADSILAALAA